MFPEETFLIKAHLHARLWKAGLFFWNKAYVYAMNIS